MDVYAIVTEKIINLLEQGVVPGAGLGPERTSAKCSERRSHIVESIISYSRSQIRAAVLVDDAASQPTWRTRSQGEESTVVVFWKVEDCRGEQRRSRSRRERRQEQSSFSAQVLPHFQSRTMRTATSSPRQTTQGRNAGAHADQRMRGDFGCMPNAPEIQHGGSKASTAR